MSKKSGMPSILKKYMEDRIRGQLSPDELYEVLSVLEQVKELEGLTIEIAPIVTFHGTSLSLSARYDRALGDAAAMAGLVTEKTGLEFSRGSSDRIDHSFQTVGSGYRGPGQVRINLKPYQKEQQLSE